MRHCPSCGGVVGLDCFNPSECAMISAREESYYRQKSEVASMTAEMLQNQFIKLLSILERNGIDLSEMYEPQIKAPTTYTNSDPDIPF